MMKTNSDESLRMLLRLLIDKIVEDLSRERQRMQEQVGSRTKPAWTLLRRIGFAGRHPQRTTVESGIL
jgi:hypothetical protein